MKKCLISLWVAILCGITACSGTPTFENAIPSTPIADLPIARDAMDLLVQMPTSVPVSLIAEADADYVLLANLYERSIPAVVNIEAQLPSTVPPYHDTSRGSGFVYDTLGHLITNAHVVLNANRIRVTFNDGYVTEATLVGVDTYSDLGVIRVNVSAERLQPLLLGDSDTVRVGYRAIALGNPFGLSSSMSVGIISGLGRTLRSAELIGADVIPGFQNPSIIQTDTPINPGNSGGPLLNSYGEVIGVTTAIRTESGVFQGVGFAVPANTVRRVVPELIDKGRVDYAWLGVSVAREENGYGVAGLAEPLGLPVAAGVLVRGVTINSPADKAGLRGGTEITEVRGQPVCRGGDIIIAVDGMMIRNMDELLSYLVSYAAPGDVIRLSVIRNGSTFDVPLTLEARPLQDGIVRDCAG